MWLSAGSLNQCVYEKGSSEIKQKVKKVKMKKSAKRKE
jgi:hypothetical protein